MPAEAARDSPGEHCKQRAQAPSCRCWCTERMPIRSSSARAAFDAARRASLLPAWKGRCGRGNLRGRPDRTAPPTERSVGVCEQHDGCRSGHGSLYRQGVTGRARRALDVTHYSDPLRQLSLLPSLAGVSGRGDKALGARVTRCIEPARPAIGRAGAGEADGLHAARQPGHTGQRPGGAAVCRCEHLGCCSVFVDGAGRCGTLNGRLAG